MRRYKPTGRPRGRPKGSVKNAEEALRWIRNLLAAGDMASSEIKRLVSNNQRLGFSWATLTAVKVRYGVASYRLGNGKATGAYFWTLKRGDEVVEAKSKKEEELSDEAEERWRKEWGPQSEQAKDRDVRDFEAKYAKFIRLLEQVAATGIHRYEDLNLLAMIDEGQQLLEKSKSIPDRQEKLERWRAMVSEVESAKKAREEDSRVKRAEREANRAMDDLF